MPDLTRITDIDPFTGQPTVVLDLQDFDGVNGRFARERGTFQFTPPTNEPRTLPAGGRRGGNRPVGNKIGNGTIAAAFRVGPDGVAGSADSAIAAASDLVATIDDIAIRPDRYVEWRPEGASKSSFYEIRGPGTWAPQYDAIRFAAVRTMPIQASWPVAPYALDLPMRFVDHMGVDTWAGGEWSQQAGTAPTVTNYQWALAAGDSRFIHRRHLYGSGERIMLRYKAPGTVPATAQYLGIIIRQQSDPNVYLAGRIRLNTSPQLDLVKGTAGGGQTALGTPVSVAQLANENNWLVVRINHLTITIEYYRGGVAHPEMAAAPTNTFTYTLTGGDATTYGVANNVPKAGRIGIYAEDLNATASNRPTIIAAGSPVHSPGAFRVEPHYTGVIALPSNVNVTHVPGDLPPKLDVDVIDESATDRAWFGIGWNSLYMATGSPEGGPPFGAIPSDRFQFGEWSTVADATALGGSVQRVALLSTGDTMETAPAQLVGWQPFGSIDDDDSSDEVWMEIYAMLRVPSTAVTPYLTVSAAPSSVEVWERFYTPEWGVTGRPLEVPTTGTRAMLHRLGTLPFPVAQPSYIVLYHKLTYGVGSSGNLDLDWTWMTPVRRTARNRTGIPLDDSYPSFLKADSRKRIHADLTADRGEFGSPYGERIEWSRAGGLGGAHIEPDVRRSGLTGLDLATYDECKGATITVAGTRQVPDNPDKASTVTDSSIVNVGLSLNVWPRHRFAAHG
jgi:hypothetical protein